jgi:hypothetical protein
MNVDDSIILESSSFPSVAPRPPAPERPARAPVPTLAELHARITQSKDCLFFISYTIPHSNVKEWQLVRVAYSATISANPQYLTDGRFLVDFYILHPEDKSYNAPNQRYWLEYHTELTSTYSDHTPSYHLIRPTRTSESYASAHGLRPYRRWVYLQHEDVYLHGPFDFATLPNGRQSRDRIAVADWQVLHSLQHLFANEPPRYDLQSFCSFHCSRLFHSEYYSEQVYQRVVATPTLHHTCFSDYIPPSSRNITNHL